MLLLPRTLRALPARSVLRPYVIAWGVVSLNTWLWSSVFHARDWPSTEKLDYFSAELSIFYGCFLGIVSTAQLLHRPRAVRMTALAVFGAYAAHIANMLRHFDYGLNMKVSVAAAISQTVLWLAYWLMGRPHGRDFILLFAGLWAAMSLELLDFPPLAYVLDAHSLWHFATVPLQVGQYRAMLRLAHTLARSE